MRGPNVVETDDLQWQHCPVRALINQLAAMWSVCVLLALADGPVRFNVLKRRVDGVTQKVLGQTLHRLEASGIVERRLRHHADAGGI